MSKLKTITPNSNEKIQNEKECTLATVRTIPVFSTQLLFLNKHVFCVQIFRGSQKLINYFFFQSI